MVDSMTSGAFNDSQEVQHGPRPGEEPTLVLWDASFKNVEPDAIANAIRSVMRQFGYEHIRLNMMHCEFDWPKNGAVIENCFADNCMAHFPECVDG